MSATLFEQAGLDATTALLACYYLVLGILAAYGCHRLMLVVELYRGRRQPSLDPPPTEWPRVTVQLPIYNELYVATRIIDAAAALDYPRDRLEIQVLDDSTDQTREVVSAAVAEWERRGVPIRLLRRDDREGFKAGALAAGLARAQGDLVAIFDADFVPAPDFLRRTVPPFTRDERLGMVQARWGHLNREFSLLTRVQAMLLDGHFVVEHAARHLSGCLFNFNGTAGIWRRQAIVEAGGWSQRTLTEDLDLSYRAQLKGWRFLYLPEVMVPAELPVEITAYKSQQHRWAMGSIQTCRKLLPQVLAAPLSRRAKLEAFVHLTANGTYPLMLALSLLIFPAMLVRRDDDPWPLLLIDLPLFGAATLAISAFFLVSQQDGELPWWRVALRLPALMAIGIGLAVNNSRAVWQGLVADGGTFHRTPKFRIESRSDGGRESRSLYRPRGNPALFLEGLLGAYFLVCFVVAASLGMWWSMPFLWLFLQGYVFVASLGLAGSRI